MGKKQRNIPDVFKNLAVKFVSCFYTKKHALIFDVLKLNDCVREIDLITLFGFNAEELRNMILELKHDKLLLNYVRLKKLPNGETRDNMCIYINYKDLTSVVKSQLDLRLNRLQNQKQSTVSGDPYKCNTCGKKFDIYGTPATRRCTVCSVVATTSKKPSSEQLKSIPPLYILLHEAEKCVFAFSLLKPAPVDVDSIVVPELPNESYLTNEILVSLEVEEEQIEKFTNISTGDTAQTDDKPICSKNQKDQCQSRGSEDTISKSIPEGENFRNVGGIQYDRQSPQESETDSSSKTTILHKMSSKSLTLEIETTSAQADNVKSFPGVTKGQDTPQEDDITTTSEMQKGYSSLESDDAQTRTIDDVSIDSSFHELKTDEPSYTLEVTEERLSTDIAEADDVSSFSDIRKDQDTSQDDDLTSTSEMQKCDSNLEYDDVQIKAIDHDASKDSAQNDFHKNDK